MVMDEHEFQRLLVLFPVIRNRNYTLADAESSGQSSTKAARSEAREWQDAWGEQDTKAQDVFWDKLRSAAEKRVGSSGAERFCDAFQKIYQKLVYEELSKELAESFVNSSSQS